MSGANGASEHIRAIGADLEWSTGALKGTVGRIRFGHMNRVRAVLTMLSMTVNGPARENTAE